MTDAGFQNVEISRHPFVYCANEERWLFFRIEPQVALIPVFFMSRQKLVAA